MNFIFFAFRQKFLRILWFFKSYYELQTMKTTTFFCDFTLRKSSLSQSSEPLPSFTSKRLWDALLYPITIMLLICCQLTSLNFQSFVVTASTLLKHSRWGHHFHNEISQFQHFICWLCAFQVLCAKVLQIIAFCFYLYYYTASQLRDRVGKQTSTHMEVL